MGFFIRMRHSRRTTRHSISHLSLLPFVVGWLLCFAVSSLSMMGVVICC